MLKGIVLEFCCPLGVGEDLPVLLAIVVVVVDTTIAVGLTTGVGSGISLLTTGVEVRLSLLTTGVEVDLSLLTTGVGVEHSLLTTIGVAVKVPPPPTIVEEKHQWVVYYVSV